MSISPTDSYKRLIELFTNRYSCRDFNPAKEVPRSMVEEVVEGARLAQSAVNRQPWTFVAVTDPALRSVLLAKSRPAFMQAPVLLVACGHHDQAWHRPADNKDHTDVDLAIAIENICLSAAALGLGCCWVCSFDFESTAQALGLPENVEPVALIPLGFAATDDIPPKNRKSLDEILRWEKF